MKTLDTQWVEELRQQTAEDILYYPMQTKMEELERRYLAFRRTLPPEEKALLDEYHHLQKRMEVCLTRIAYNAGVSHGRKQAGLTETS